jgi:Flp pilus assembly protein CpaB
MRGRRTVYLVIFLAAALGSFGLAALAQPRTDIVRATTDIPHLTPITADMVTTVRVSPVGLAADTARSVDEVVGQYTSVAIIAGQDVDRRVLEANPGERSFGFGAPLGPGEVAFAIPLDPAQAIGGALSPGARVDVVAVPNSLRTQTLSSTEAEAPEPVVLGEGLTVLALRTGGGEQLLVDSEDESGGGRVAIAPTLGAVVVAIPRTNVVDFAGASVTSTFVLALSPTIGKASGR